MDYKLVDDDHIEDFQNEVNNLIKQGYKPIGGVAVSNYVFVQAMIKEEEE